MRFLLVPTLRVGTHAGDTPRRIQSLAGRASRAAERPDVRSHAERGNENPIPCLRCGLAW